MTNLIALAVLLLPSRALACGAIGGENGLVARIEAKFGLKAEDVAYMCGGGAMSFRYRPPENLVPDTSYFKEWNKEFSLGAVSSAADLRAMLELTREQMDELILANVRFMQDGYETENRYGVRAYHPNALPASQRITDQGTLMFVTAPHCWGSWRTKDEGSTSAQQLGRLHFPVHSLEGLALIGRVPFYRKGDTLRLILADSQVSANLRRVAQDNLDYISRERRTDWCARGFEPGVVVDWREVLKLP